MKERSQILLINNYIKRCIILHFFLSSTFAGVNGITVHSRANCINNESITWHLGYSYNWRTVSFHNFDYNNPGKGAHMIDTGLQNTWRSAAVHWGEAMPGGIWYVTGFHFGDEMDYQLLIQNTAASDCSLYDGWWDY